MISHRNVIANTRKTYLNSFTISTNSFTVQIATYDKPYRDTLINDVRNQSDYTENVLGLLPMSHIYGLVVICHASVYRGDGVIVLPKFDFTTTLQSIQDYKINTLFLVCLLKRTNSFLSYGPGTTYYYFDDQERKRTCEVRPQLCSLHLHGCGAPGTRDCRGFAKDIPVMENPTRLR